MLATVNSLPGHVGSPSLLGGIAVDAWDRPGCGVPVRGVPMAEVRPMRRLPVWGFVVLAVVAIVTIRKVFPRDRATSDAAHG